MSPAEWARSVVAAQENEEAPAGQGEGKTGTPTGGTIVYTVPTSTDSRIPSWVSQHGSDRLDGELYADRDAHVYVDAWIETSTTEAGIEMSAPRITIDGELVTTPRPLTVDELELLADALARARDAVEHGVVRGQTHDLMETGEQFGQPAMTCACGVVVSEYDVDTTRTEFERHVADPAAALEVPC